MNTPSRLSVPHASLVSYLRAHAEHQPDKPALINLHGTLPSRTLTYADWYRWSHALAQRLGERRCPTVLLPMETGLEFLVAFMAGLMAGVPVVPLPSPTGRSGWRRFQKVAADCGSHTLMIDSASYARLARKRNADQVLANFQCLEIEKIAPTDRLEDLRFDPAPESLAFLQYTSGSTGDPKGVMVTHANLIHNEAMIATAMDHKPHFSFLTWLPLFHDMGLICAGLQSLYLGATCYLMPPTTFIQRPMTWLEAISGHGIHASGAPDFAFRLCCQGEPPPSNLDLSCWQVAFNGAEAIRPSTLSAFTQRFAPHGFRDSAFFNGYGMAEATLLISGRHAAPIVTHFDEAALSRDQALPVPSDRGVALVCCGTTFHGQEMQIVEPVTHRILPENRVGEVWLRGPSMAAGYWGRPELTEDIFRARPVPAEALSAEHASTNDSDKDYLRTGDLGFIHEGRLYLTGRLKDMIVVRGLNYYPQDLEYSVEAAHPNLMAHGSAAFSLDQEQGEQLVVVSEVTRAAVRNLNPEELFATIRQAIAAEHELTVSRLVLVRPGQLPKTTSGKIQRSACRKALLDGTLEPLASAEWATAGSSLSTATLSSAGPRGLREALASILALAPAELDAARPLTWHGLDSLGAMRMQSCLATEFGLDLELSELLDDLSLADLQACYEKQQAEPTSFGGAAFEAQARPTAAAPSPADRGESFPLSWNQQGMWLQQQRRHHGTEYHVAAALAIAGPLEIERLGRLLKELVTRHAILRVRLEEQLGQVRQCAADVAGDLLVQLDGREWDEPTWDRSLRELIAKPFDLAAGPLFRAWLVQRDQPILILSAHHLVVDLWSLSLMLAELGSAFRGEELPLAGSSYRDFAVHQHEQLAGTTGERLRRHWQTKLDGMPAPLRLPGGNRPDPSDAAGALNRVLLAADESDQLRRLARSLSTTPAVVLLAAFQAALQSLGAALPGCLGLTCSGREARAWRGLVGCTVNLLPIASAPTASFGQAVGQARAAVVEAMAHSALPLAQIAAMAGRRAASPLLK